MMGQFSYNEQHGSDQFVMVSKRRKRISFYNHFKKMVYFCITLCIVVTIMIIGSLIVYFTAPTRSKICELTFKRTMKSFMTYSSQPRSVVGGDFNNDHQIDIVVVNSGTNTIGVLIGQGNGTFTNQQTYSTGYESRPYAVAINDFNNDTYTDIIVANYNTNNIGLFIGYGNGTFHEQKLIPLGSSHPLFVTSADFNKDQCMDIAVVNYGTHTISILLGYGNESFQNPISYSTGYDSFPSSLAIGDLNKDTHLDIAVANYGTDNIGIFLNYGDGTFTNQQIYTTILNSSPTSITLGDFNNDNSLDIVVANYGSGSVGIFFGFDNGTFLPQVSYTISSYAYPQYVTINNINKNNVLDIVIVDSHNDHIYVLPGHGNGTFATIATYDAVFQSMPMWITIDDFNNNSQADVVVVNYGSNSVIVLMDYFAKLSVRLTKYHGGESTMLCGVAVSDFNNDGIIDIVFNAADYITILIGIGDKNFDEQITYIIDDESVTQYVCTGDVNNDNRMDIIVADTGLDGVVVFLGYGDGTFGSMTISSTGVGSSPWWAAVGDLNDDGMLDIVSANTGTHSIGILYGSGDGNFAPVVIYPIGNTYTPYSLGLGDINNDNRLDIVVISIKYTCIIFFAPDYNIFISMPTYSTGMNSDPTSIFLADFNGDKQLDVVVANTFTDNVGVLLGYGNGTFGSQTTYLTGSGSQPYYVIVADYNNDNISDIIATNFGNDQVAILYGYGNGNFQLARNYSTGFSSKPFGIVAADLDNDAHLELVIALAGVGDISILTEYNAAEFINKTVYPTGAAPEPTSVAIADFDHDNQSDIVVANAGRDSLSILLASNNHTFSTEIIYPIGTDSHPQYVMTCDINKDNHIDIVTVNSRVDSISIIMGYGNGSFAEQMIYATGEHSYPSDVVAGDVNNDNRLDLVIANRGTNNIGILFGYDYTSFQTQQNYSSISNIGPRSIVVSDFNNDNILDIAVAFYDSDSWCILLGYGNGSFIMAKTYMLSSGSRPRGIGVGDFNSDNQTDIVIVNDGSDSIGVALGYGNASFSTITLYSTGIGSRPKGVAFGDFNNDNQSDIVVTNYGSGNIGIFLGHGNGSFATMMTYPTGQASFPIAATVADFNNDSRLDIAVANYGTSNVGILFGYSDGTFSQQVIFRLGATATSIAVGDFNRDNHIDIATANYNGDTVGILLGYRNGSFSSVITYSAGDGSVPRSICVGDFNNDNILDIAVANYGTNNIVVLFGFGDGSFLLGSPYSTDIGSLPYAVAIGDFNRDNRLDIAVANQKSSTVGILLGNDSQPFAGVTIYPIDGGLQPHSLALADFNNDSWLDIVVANYATNNIGILFGRLHGDFRQIQLYPTGYGSAPYSVAVSDFNNDTYLDIVVTNSKTATIVLFLGDGTGKFRNGSTYSTGTQSRPYTVTIGDFNNDKESDIAIANSGVDNVLLLYGYGNGSFGNQTSYPFGFGYQPYSIAIGDLNEDGWMDLVIACYGTDHVEILMKMC